MVYERGLATKELGKVTMERALLEEALTVLTTVKAIADCREV